MISTELMKMLDENLVYLATSSPEAKPNVVPIGLCQAINDKQLIIIDGGLWFLDAAYSLPYSGSWKATHSLANFFKSGDMLLYNATRYKTTLSVWVK